MNNDTSLDLRVRDIRDGAYSWRRVTCGGCWNCGPIWCSSPLPQPICPEMGSAQAATEYAVWWVSWGFRLSTKAQT